MALTPSKISKYKKKAQRGIKKVNAVIDIYYKELIDSESNIDPVTKVALTQTFTTPKRLTGYFSRKFEAKKNFGDVAFNVDNVDSIVIIATKELEDKKIEVDEERGRFIYREQEYDIVQSRYVGEFADTDIVQIFGVKKIETTGVSR